MAIGPGTTKTLPPKQQHVILEIPAAHVLLVTLNRPKQMNSLTMAGCWEMDLLWKWYDAEPEL
jgi:enoyl-CoA hydratase/carnithine racemase